MSQKGIFKCPKCNANIELERSFIFTDMIALPFFSLITLVSLADIPVHAIAEAKCPKCQADTEIFVPVGITIFWILIFGIIFYAIYALLDGFLRILGFVFGIVACCFFSYFMGVNSLDIRMKSTKVAPKP